MAILASNSLTGTDGSQVTSFTLSGTGTAPADVVQEGLTYSNTYLIRGRNSIRMRSNFTRDDSGQITFALPASGPWSLRFYVRPEPLSSPYDMQEYRHLLTLGTSALVMRESSGRNVVTRLQPEDLAAANSAGAESGSAVTFDQLLRYEFTFDGTDTLTSYVYAGDSTTGARINEWTHTPDNNAFTISSYRWRKYTTLQLGDTDASTGGLVTPYQEKLLVWDPNSLPQFGADGDYGGETQSATQDFQTQFGLLVDGVAGPETHSALDLVVALDADPNDYPIPFWIGNMVVTDTGDPVGPLDPSEQTLTDTVQFQGTVEAEETTVSAHGTFTVDSTLQTFTTHNVDVSDSVAFGSEGAQVTSAVDADTEIGGVGFQPSLQISGQSFIPEPPELGPQFELWIYDPNGGLRGTLPYPISWTASVPLNDIGTMQLTVSAETPGSHLLSAPFEVALRLRPSDSDTFIEPPGCRFISLRRQRDWTDRQGLFTWHLANWGWQLRKARLNTNSVTVQEREFEDMAAGAILAEIAPEPFFNLQRNFNSVEDTNDNNWVDSQTITYPYGTDFLSIQQEWAEQSIVHWRFNQRIWEVFRADLTLHDARDEVLIRAEGNILEANDLLSFEDVADRVRYVSDLINPLDPEVTRTINGVVSTSDDIRWWGRWEDFISVPGGTDITTATAAANARLQLIHNARFQSDRRFVAPNNPLPLYHYNAGSLIRIEDADERLPGQPDNVWTIRDTRVEQIVLSYDRDRHIEAQVTTDNLFPTRDVVIGRMLKAINGTANAVMGARSILPF